MFIPLHDSNNLKHIKLQWVTWSLIASTRLSGVTELAGAESEFVNSRRARPWIHSLGGQ
jgi:hypothetical protein